MFANFFGIVIISASALLIAGLVLRPTPDLPATMNLGLVDKLTESTSSAASDNSTTTDTSSSNESEASTSGDSATANSAPVEQASTDNASSDVDKAKAEEAVSQTATDSVKAIEETAEAVTDKVESSANEVAPAATGLSKEYLEIRRRAIEQAGSAHTRRNKSDAPNMKDQ